MFETIGEAEAYLRAEAIHMVDLKFSDLWGRWRHVSVPAHEFNATLMREGVGFDGSSVGLKSVKAGDMVLVPDLATAFCDPFWEITTLSFICAADEPTPSSRFPATRATLPGAQKPTFGRRVQRMSHVGDPTHEFYVFDEVSLENEVNRAAYRLESREAAWRSVEGGHGHLIPPHGGYHAIPPKDQLYNMRSEVAMHLERMGVRVSNTTTTRPAARGRAAPPC